jgi:hypothetical protein
MVLCELNMSGDACHSCIVRGKIVVCGGSHAGGSLADVGKRTRVLGSRQVGRVPLN